MPLSGTPSARYASPSERKPAWPARSPDPPAAPPAAAHPLRNVTDEPEPACAPGATPLVTEAKGGEVQGPGLGDRDRLPRQVRRGDLDRFGVRVHGREQTLLQRPFDALGQVGEMAVRDCSRSGMLTFPARGDALGTYPDHATTTFRARSTNRPGSLRRIPPYLLNRADSVAYCPNTRE